MSDLFSFFVRFAKTDLGESIFGICLQRIILLVMLHFVSLFTKQEIAFGHNSSFRRRLVSIPGFITIVRWSSPTEILSAEATKYVS